LSEIQLFRYNAKFSHHSRSYQRTDSWLHGVFEVLCIACTAATLNVLGWVVQKLYYDVFTSNFLSLPSNGSLETSNPLLPHIGEATLFFWQANLAAAQGNQNYLWAPQQVDFEFALEHLFLYYILYLVCKIWMRLVTG
jgi:hypothetical protein